MSRLSGESEGCGLGRHFWWGFDGGGGCLRSVGKREEGMSAVMTLIDAIVAVSPVTLVAGIALPVASVSIRLADITERAGLDTPRGIVF